MRQVIYLDVLISVNLIVNYFLLTATAKFMYIKYSKIHIFLGSMLGALFSLYIFFPKLNLMLSIFIKILMAMLIVLVTFPKISKKKFFKTIMCFFLVNFSFSGIIFAIWLAFSPRGVIVKNNVVYFGISPVVLVISTAFAYTIFKVINKFSGKYVQKNFFLKIGFVFLDKSPEFIAKIDTGNSLRETFSDLPVMVVKKSKFKVYYGEFLSNISNFFDISNTKIKFRMIPYRTVSGDGVLPAFKPDYVYFFDENQKIKKEAYVAISENFSEESEFDALVNQEILV